RDRGYGRQNRSSAGHDRSLSTRLFFGALYTVRRWRAFIPMQVYLRGGGERNGTGTGIGSRALAREWSRSRDRRSVSRRERVSTASRGTSALRSGGGARTHGALRAPQGATAGEDRRALDGGGRSQAARRFRRRSRAAGIGGGARAHDGGGEGEAVEVRPHQRIRVAQKPA